jgi:uncharacterized protein (TIGR02246 family)
MSNNMTPEKFLESYVDYFNKGNISSILKLYESDASFALKPGKVVKGHENIRDGIQSFVDMKGRLESNVKRVLKSNDVALVITEWSFNGTAPDGNAVTFAGKATDVLRQQSDGTWHILIDNPWGTE